MNPPRNPLMKRRAPLARLATAAVGLVFLVEAAVIGGILEIPARTVGRYAPWAYEAFLRLVGEHPDELPSAALLEHPAGRGTNRVERAFDATGLDPSAIPRLFEKGSWKPEPPPASSETTAPRESLEKDAPPARKEEPPPVG